MSDTTPPTPDDGREQSPAPPPGQPLPPYGQPAPPYGQPAPPGQPLPPYGQPAPPDGQPASPYGQPASPYGQPAPPYGQPAPPYGQPAPPGQPLPPYGQYGPPPGAPPYGPQGGYGLVPGPVDPLGRPLADWWQRAVAIIIDSIIVSIPSFILLAIVGGGSTSSGSGTAHPGAGVAGELLSLVITLAYFGWLDGSPSGQTVGKRLLGIATRDARTGGPVGTGRAVLRRFLYVILFALFFVPGVLNALSPLWDRRRQAWHDKAASSDVVKVR